MNGALSEKEYSIHYYEIDYKKKALITALMDYFGDMSMQQTEDLKVGLDFLSKNKLAWVLYKWNININRYPVYNEKIRVGTQAYGMRKYYAYRKFYIIDSNNKKIVEADSIWFLINTDERKIMRIPDYMYDIYKISRGCKDLLSIDKLKKPKKIDVEKQFNVRYGDIDTNKHVNNVKYVAWAIETVPQDIVIKNEINNLKVNYIKETSYGSVVKVKTQIIKGEDKIICLHDIQNEQDETLALVQTIWR